MPDISNEAVTNSQLLEIIRDLKERVEALEAAQT